MEKKTKSVEVELKEFNDKERSFLAVASTEDPDSFGDIVKQDGWVLDRFKKNPIIPWGHDYHALPVATAEKIYVKDDKLYFKAKFPKKGIYQFADTVYDFYKENVLRAFSVGFMPLEFEENDYGGLTFKKQELLEISSVTIPANENALAMAFQKSMNQLREMTASKEAQKYIANEARSSDTVLIETDTVTYGSDTMNYKTNTEDISSSYKLQEFLSSMKRILNKEKTQIKTFTDDNNILAQKAIPPNHEPPKDEDTNWDASRAINNLRKWASSDGSGDKDTIDWNKYKMGFGYYDAEDKENFGSYKLPHHDIIEGTFKVLWSGVVAAMAALLGARGGVDMPDDEKKRCYNHLANHYKQFDKEPPEYESIEQDVDYEESENEYKDADDSFELWKNELEARLDCVERKIKVIQEQLQEIDMKAMLKTITKKLEREE